MKIKEEAKVFSEVDAFLDIIDEKGIIIKSMPKVKPDTNAQEILEFLWNIK